MPLRTERQRRSGGVEQAVRAGRSRQRGAVAADPGARPLRSGQRQAVGVDRDQGIVPAEQHGPVPFGRNGHPPRPQAVEHVARLVPLALNPRGRAPRRGVRARPVPVAAADRDRRRVPGQPPGQRGGPAQVEPAPVPGLDQRRRRRIGRVQLTGPANGWLTDSSPPAASVASSQVSGSWRKSIQPTSEGPDYILDLGKTEARLSEKRAIQAGELQRGRPRALRHSHRG